MGVKYIIFAVLTAFLVLAVNPASGAVDTTEIDKVRNKGVLDSEDFRIIDDFVSGAVQELVQTIDFMSVAKTRLVFLGRSRSVRAAQAQYAGQFSESAYKYISSGLEESANFTPEERKFKATLNLLILVDGLEDLKLVDLALPMLNDENAAICYWAVHSITNAGIIEQLNSDKVANLELARRITGQLKPTVEGAGSEITTLMAKFAAELDIAQGEALLLQIADVRISRYADWRADCELLDSAILKSLHDKMSSAGSTKPAIGRRFAQLYSYAMQRYIKDIKGGNFLSDTQKQQLASVLVETEDKCLGKILGIRQSIIKRSVEQGDIMRLLLEHSRLLGDDTRPGQFALKLNFDYGQNPDGSRRTAPLALQDPPKP